MLRQQRTKLFLALTVGAQLLAGCSSQPTQPSFELQKNILAISSENSTAYLILQPKRAVLINSGSDPKASEIIQSLKNLNRSPNQVLAVFITAAHQDLSAGAAQFKMALTYIGAKDYRSLRGDKHPKALLPKLQARLSPRPVMPHNIAVVQAGDRIDEQGFKIDVIETPGASRGSVMYLFEEVLFTGDGLYFIDGKLSLPSSLGIASRSDLKKSLSRLVRSKFHTIADGLGNTGSIGPKDIAAFIQSLD